ncbi:MAG: class I SAM-dependent methyltransferase [Planctomycetota bacterium]
MPMNVLDQQIGYYKARADEYDEWFFRKGRYDRGPELNQLWHSDVAAVRRALEAFKPSGEVLELACGTGLWTNQLAECADSVLAVDAAEEMLTVNKRRVARPNVAYELGDIYQWATQRKFDCVFFGFWLSHVPEDRFQSFWQLVRSVLKPNGRVFFVDSLPNPESGASNHPVADASATVQERFLNDGRRFQIIKRYFDVDDLRSTLCEFGWQVSLRTTPNFFLYGELAFTSKGDRSDSLGSW